VVERRLLLAIADQSPEQVLAALEASCRARLLEEEGLEAYRYARDLVREVVEGHLSTARRAVQHRRTGEALESLPGMPSAELLAYHYARSDDVDKAVCYLEQAGDAAMTRLASVAAEGYYRDLAARLVRAIGIDQDQHGNDQAARQSGLGAPCPEPSPMSRQ
jgi:hypothetical protein